MAFEIEKLCLLKDELYLKLKIKNYKSFKIIFDGTKATHDENPL